jgi:hypothetical protein
MGFGISPPDISSRGHARDGMWAQERPASADDRFGPGTEAGGDLIRATDARAQITQSITRLCLGLQGLLSATV